MSEILKPSSTVEFTPEDVKSIVRGLCLVAPDWPLGLCGRAAILIQQQAAELAAALKAKEEAERIVEQLTKELEECRRSK